ncbi:hypothetical protein SDC9_120926 [bioreactor metagenome]|uniref:Uncharacterized protein n=1 Tax=bioreactor metagenome TaxID=1076179 RepID=A0A645CAI1_9ZZZZ
MVLIRRLPPCPLASISLTSVSESIAKAPGKHKKTKNFRIKSIDSRKVEKYNIEGQRWSKKVGLRPDGGKS